MYFSATLFSMAGFDKATAVSIVVGGTNFLFGFINFASIDRFGRRVVLLVTVLGMVRKKIKRSKECFVLKTCQVFIAGRRSYRVPLDSCK